MALARLKMKFKFNKVAATRTFTVPQWAIQPSQRRYRDDSKRYEMQSRVRSPRAAATSTNRRDITTDIVHQHKWPRPKA